MSIIQSIRDKGARVAVVLIALALIGFILMDAFTGRSNLFGGGASSTLGRVNGKKIDSKEFARKIEIQEQQYKQQGQQVEQSQLVQALWEQEVKQVILSEEFEKLGLNVSDKELTDMLYGMQPHQYAKQYFYGDANTMEYDPSRVQSYVAQIKRGKDQEQKNNFNSVLAAMESDRLTEKYKYLVAGSIHFPKWYLEKQNADNSLMAKLSYVIAPDSTVSDSVKELAVSDKEINDYISKHKDQFKLEDEIRTIQYVKFSAAPTTADSTAIKGRSLALKPEFDTTKNMEEFIRANSELPYYNSYISKSHIQVPQKDSILKLPVGGVYGPYVDKQNFVLAKIMDVKQWSDTANIRHILVATHQRTQQSELVPVREDSVAKKTIDSIQLAIKNGKPFDSLLVLSDDPGSKDKGGVYEKVPTGQMVGEFNDFIFGHKPGESGIVKTEFGYHYIEILSQKGGQPAYKIAYLAKLIESSPETERTAENAALQFAGEARDLKTFDTVYKKTLEPKGIQKLFAPDINSHAYEIQGLGASRTFIKNIFAADKGEVMQPERVGSDFIVAVVTEIYKKGTMPASLARRYVEPVLRKEKKVAEIKKKIGPITTLEALSTKMNLPIQSADSIRYNSRENTPLSFEYKVVGAAFNTANKGKVVPEGISGNYGVYVIRIDNVTTTAVENADIAAQRKSMEGQARMNILFSSQMSQYGQQQYDPADVLRKSATIKDYRNDFY